MRALNVVWATIYEMDATETGEPGLMTTQLKLFSHPKVKRSAICGMQVHFLSRQLKRMTDGRTETCFTWFTISIHGD